MSKRQKKKAPAVEELPAAEAETKTEYIYMRTPNVSLVLSLSINGVRYTD